MKTFERILNILAWIGFVALVPVALSLFGIPGPLEFLRTNLGRFGSSTFLVIVFYGLVVLRILFGKSELYAPVMIGVVVSFLLMATCVSLSFMDWYRSATDKIVYLTDHRVVFVVSLGVAALGIALGRLKKLHWIAQILLLVVLPLALIVAAHLYGVTIPGKA